MMNNGTARFALAFAALAALVGCGGGGSPSPAPVPAPVGVASFEPADGSTKVDLHPALKIAFDGRLDASSVTTDHVKLLAHGYPQVIAVTYDDASRTISVQPGAPLRHDVAYTLSATGLVDATGKGVTPKQAAFHTWINAHTGNVNYRISLDPSGRVATQPSDDRPGSYVSFTRRSDGLIAKVETWDAGTDGAWFTSDDLRYSVADYVYDTNGSLLTITTRHDAASDLRLDTLVSYAYNEHGDWNQFTRRYPGTDRVLGTSDDYYNYAVATFDDKGALQHTLTARGYSTDVAQFTAADVYALYVVTPAAAGRPERDANYDGMGADGVAFTSDDLLRYYDERTFDARGNVVKLVSYDADDTGVFTVSYYRVYTYDNHDNHLQQTLYTSPGADGRWFTADDPVDQIYGYDATH